MDCGWGSGSAGGSVVEYDQTISGEAQFRSTEFTCVKGNGDFLSYGFDNTAGADCMVELYKKGLIWDTKVSSMTVRPHDPGGKTEVIRNPSDSTFYFVLYAADGGTICGHLQAYQ